MKLATLRHHTRDGRLVIVSRDLSMAAPAGADAPTMQAAVERWRDIEPSLRQRAEDLERGRLSDAAPFVAESALAPLPRAWQWLDASAFPSHGDLMQKAFNQPPIPTDPPLMYQGLSHRFLAPTEDAPTPDEALGIDFEGEFGVIVDDVPMGVTPEAALAHLRLVVQINDWSLRVAGAREMKTGFGWVQAKPACSMAPIALTPDELGSEWRDGRVHLNLHVWWNGALFGAPEAGSMAFGFHELVAHAAATRDLCAGTIIGSGTVSNANFRAVGSTCIAERRGIELVDYGEPRTGFMRFGDRVRMQAQDSSGAAPFGAIDQQVTRP